MLPFPQAVLEASFKASMEVFREQCQEPRVEEDLRRHATSSVTRSLVPFHGIALDTFMSSKKL